MSGLPAGGFRWVEPDEAPQAPLRRSRRRWWLGAVFVVVLATVAGVVAVKVWAPWSPDRRAADAPPAAPPIGTPEDLLVSFPLNRQPVPGWQLTAADMGLPPGVKLGNLFTRNGTKAYFVALQGCDKKCRHPTGWIYGLDVTTGARLFPPVALPEFFGDCYGNGPAVAVCTSSVVQGTEQYVPPPGAWVIDLERGALTYSGPNTLNPRLGGDTRLEPVGYKYGPTYLLAAKYGEGLHGVGPHAEMTWFLPGSGEVSFPATWDPDVPPLTLAVQPLKDVHDERGNRVFSIADGKDMTPTPPAGTRLEEVETYNGGFAYQFDAGKVTGTLMYDTSGRMVGRQQPQRSYPRRNAAMLTLAVGGTFQIYDAAGKLVATIPSRNLHEDFTVIGTKLFIRTEDSGYGDQTAWQQWDLLTAQPGRTCTMQFGSGYVGSDGTVVITRQDASEGTTYAAIDTTTCQTLWEIPGKIWLYKVGTGLIEHDIDRDVVMSLHAPK